MPESIESIPLTPLESRELEVAKYQANIDTYTAILATLSPDLPAHLEAYRSRTDKHAAIAEIENLDDVIRLSDAWHHAEVKGRIRTEMLEQRKSQSILDYLRAQ